MSLGKAVNDDVEERIWAKILVQAVENGMEESEVARMFDDLTGLDLDPREVKEARKEEMAFVKGLRVYEEKPIEECWERTGKNPIGTRWVDILEGALTRSRWVAQDFKKKGDDNREDLFAAMPPLETKKALYRLAAPRLFGR